MYILKFFVFAVLLNFQFWTLLSVWILPPTVIKNLLYHDFCLFCKEPVQTKHLLELNTELLTATARVTMVCYHVELVESILCSGDSSTEGIPFNVSGSELATQSRKSI